MEDAGGTGELHGTRDELGVGLPARKRGASVERGRHPVGGLHAGERAGAKLLGREESGDVEIAGGFRRPPAPFAVHRPIGAGARLNAGEIVLRHNSNRACGAGEVDRALHERQLLLRRPFALLAIDAGGDLGGLLVVASERLVGDVGNAVRQRREVEHPEQCIAAADVRIQEPERLTGLDGFDPERHFRELDRHRVAVDAIDAAARNIAKRTAIVGRRSDAAGPSSCKPGNSGGSPEATRRAFNKRFLLDLAEDWQQHGREVFKRVRRESPAAYLKVCAMLVPREMKLEHSGGVKAMTDEQIERSIELIKEILAQREAGANAKLIDGEPVDAAALPAPDTRAG
jgi:hypothetical protein